MNATMNTTMNTVLQELPPSTLSHTTKFNHSSKMTMNNLEFRRSPLCRYTTTRRWTLLCRHLRTQSGLDFLNEFPESFHFILDYGPTQKVVQTILRRCPGITHFLNKFGMTPLHIVCATGGSSDIVKILIEHEKKYGMKGSCAKAVDAGLNTPLHYVAKYLTDPLHLGASGSSTVFATCSIVEPDHFEDILLSIHEIISVARQTIHCRNLKHETPFDIFMEFLEDNSTRCTYNWDAVLFSLLGKDDLALKATSTTMITPLQDDYIKTISKYSSSPENGKDDLLEQGSTGSSTTLMLEVGECADLDRVPPRRWFWPLFRRHGCHKRAFG